MSLIAHFPKHALLIVLTLLLLCGCNKEDEITSQSLSGNVQLFTEDGARIDDSDMIVSIDGRQGEVITDDNGKFYFSNLDFGNHLLVFNKDGFGQYKKPVVHARSETPNVLNEFIKIGQKSTAQVSALDVQLLGDFLIISIYSDPVATSSKPRYFHTFFHNDKGVSFNDFTTFETNAFSFSPSNYSKSLSFFYNSGFESGEEIFIKAYATSKIDNVYYDPGAGQTIFPNLNPGTVDAASFILP